MTPLLTLLAVLATSAGPALDPAAAKTDEKTGLVWYDAKAIGLEGQAWTDTLAPYDRLPKRVEKTVRPPVWGLSRDSAGIAVRFVTDSPAVHCRWTLTRGNLAMPHMPASGVSGVDLYAKVKDKWQWVKCGFGKAQTNTEALVEKLPPGEREYLLYLPLYNGVSSVEIGVANTAKLMQPDPRPEGKNRPIVFYGTSITQGASASRPGMVHTAILGRRFDVPVVNLGFSGNGTLDPEFIELLAEIDAAVYVLDCLPNLQPDQVAARVEPFVNGLRKLKPDTPILLVEDRNYTNSPFDESRAARNAGNQAALKKAYENLTKAEVKWLFYLPAEKLLGDDFEGSVDGSHPTDLGFMRQADAFAETLQPALRK
ncbi:MAG TPA: SGNH/GDSL hydrolase family protein [Pirellulales bacterium]